VTGVSLSWPWFDGQLIGRLSPKISGIYKYLHKPGEVYRSTHLHIYVELNMLLCMRTTLEISDEIFRQLKRKAADEGATVRQLVENALRIYLAKPKPRKGYRLHWRSERGRILPGVRLDDRDALFDIMDGRS
jgi:hypothetical protein